MKLLKSSRNAVIGLLFCISLISISLVPTPAYAIGDAAVVFAIHVLAAWLKNEMMSELHNYTQEQTNALTGKMTNIFEQKVNWEKWPASLKELFVEQSVKYEDDAKEAAYKNSQDYLSYTQGSSSGVNATKYPAKAVAAFNQQYDSVQKMGTSCQLDVPQPVGDTSNRCQPAQTQFTNYLITGVHPMPAYPDNALNTAAGQQYIAEQKVNETRTGLAQLALNQTTDPNTTKFIQYMQQNLQKPSADQINSESSAAIARDTLIIEQAKAIIELKNYEVALMNERLLATLVSQNEDVHQQHIRALGRNIH